MDLANAHVMTAMKGKRVKLVQRDTTEMKMIIASVRQLFILTQLHFKT